MKRTTRSAAFLLAVAMLLPQAGCGTARLAPEETEETEEVVSATATAEPEKPAPATTVRKTYNMTSHSFGELADKIRLLGERTNITEQGLVTEWACSGFEMTLLTEGTHLEITVDSTYTTFFKTYVDGEEQPFRAAPGGKGQVCRVARDIPAGTHLVRVVKDGQPDKNGGNCTVTALSFEGTVLETDRAEKDLFLEFIGDSIWTGVGALGDRGSSPNYSSEISATTATPYRTAMALNADYNVTARGSIGVVREAGVLDAFGLFHRLNGYRDEVPYEPRRSPDAVIICLGANDPAAEAERFVERGKAFIEEIRAAYGRDVKIVWTYGMFSKTHLVEEIRKIAADCGGEEAGVYALEMIYGKNGSGSKETNRHPSSSDHEKNAAHLVPFLREILHLK